MRLGRQCALTDTIPTILTRVLRTATTRRATLLMAFSSVLDRGITGDIQPDSGTVATTDAHMSAATGTMIAGQDADGTATGMHTEVGAIPAEAKCITTPAIGSE